MADEDFENEDLSPEQIAKAQKENCIFCKIISGDIPSKKVYEDSDFVGILDINPATEGHVLLLPKQHFQILPQMPPEIVGNLGIACSNVSSKILKTFKCDGTSVFMANGAIAGQRAPHFMVHIIPRKENDNISLNPSLKEIDEKSFISIKETLFSSVQRPSSATYANSEDLEEERAEQENDAQERIKENEEEKKKDLDDAASESKFEEETKTELHKKSKGYEQAEEDETKQKKKVAAKKKEKTNNKKPEDKRTQESTNIDFDKLTRLFK